MEPSLARAHAAEALCLSPFSGMYLASPAKPLNHSRVPGRRQAHPTRNWAFWGTTDCQEGSPGRELETAPPPGASPDLLPSLIDRAFSINRCENLERPDNHE